MGRPGLKKFREVWDLSFFLRGRFTGPRLGGLVAGLGLLRPREVLRAAFGSSWVWGWKVP